MHAIVAGSFEQAAVLIAYGASLEAKNYRGCTVPRRSTGESGWEQDGNVENIWQKHGKTHAKLRKTCELCEFQEENVRLIVGFQWETYINIYCSEFNEKKCGEDFLRVKDMVLPANIGISVATLDFSPKTVDVEKWNY